MLLSGVSTAHAQRILGPADDAVTLPRLMWMGLRDNIDPAIAAISVLLICVVVIVILGKTLFLGNSEAKTK